MILLLDTSTAVCKLTFVDGDWRVTTDWQADRGLAKGLLQYLHSELTKYGKKWSDIHALAVFRGPGSFTGLRIGITVANTIAESEAVPIVGTEGDDWRQVALERLQAGENDQLVLPLYGSEAHITQPRK